jgi:hypothetical protein
LHGGKDELAFIIHKARVGFEQGREFGVESHNDSGAFRWVL